MTPTAERLVERELKDTDLDALFHARLVALCKASLPRLALLVPKANGI